MLQSHRDGDGRLLELPLWLGFGFGLRVGRWDRVRLSQVPVLVLRCLQHLSGEQLYRAEGPAQRDAGPDSRVDAHLITALQLQVREC